MKINEGLFKCSSSFLFSIRYLLLYDNNNFNNNITIMSLFLKLFENHTQYETYTASAEFITPNVSLCTTEGDVHYNPYVKTMVAAKYNVTDISSPTKLCNSNTVSQFSEIEIDGVVQPSVVSEYTFSATGEHTVKYTLTDPTSIGQSTFIYCSDLTSIVIPDSVTSIGNNAFQNCSGLTSIVIPSGVTSIGQSAFYNCSGLTSCTIGSGVTSIGGYAFYNCGGLTSMVCNVITAPTIYNTTFQNVKTGGILTVPQGSSGYNVWMGTGNYYLGKYNWTKVEQ